ncbi:hypothetical protein CCY99_07235 [Helicobacter sp. 16-1353]|uniref:glycosyltransferase family 9 protein n=1 Tax=Helicobacter sp. 16-1353 TaxID=2004996 RepID=UPI000DCDFDD1|nr:glycosyltransferase family 9 protein [Helicobacter sp. 16-1353]RAX52435.1 hypothetical protein CCY99_07235 [Helicobacter sp. 16-1353]
MNLACKSALKPILKQCRNIAFLAIDLIAKCGRIYGKIKGDSRRFTDSADSIDSIDSRFAHDFIKPGDFIRPKDSTQIAIIKVDAIGDYILFRNFLCELKSHLDSNLSLICNESYKELALKLDSKIVDNFIFISRPKMMRSLLYRLKTLFFLESLRFDILLNPTFSKCIISEALANHINAGESVAPIGNTANLSTKNLLKENKKYTKLLANKSGNLFEFYRNMEFFEQFLGVKLDTKLFIDSAFLPSFEILRDKFSLIKPYSILFIGASSPNRKWSAENFAKMARHILERKYNIVICGLSEDCLNAEKIINLAQGKYAESGAESKIESTLKIAKDSAMKSTLNSKTDSAPDSPETPQIKNLCGKTTLLELAGIVYNGNHMVANETSVAHLASALDTTSIVVYNGNHLNRFIPYPKEICDKYYYVLHPQIATNAELYAKISNTESYKSTLNIDEISAESVIAIYEKALNGGGGNSM